MTAGWVSTDELWAGDARDLADHATAHSWIVDAHSNQDDPECWPAVEPGCCDETLILQLHEGCMAHKIVAHYKAVDQDGGYALFSWTHTAQIDGGEPVWVQRACISYGALHRLIVQLGVIDLREVA